MTRIKNTPRTSRIFVRQVTVLDCAVLHPEHGPLGYSWYVDVIWEGEQTEEGVVFDFSLAKKSAKTTVDDLFDHRLFVAESQVTSSGDGRTRVLYQNAAQKNYFALDTYDDALAVLPDPVLISACSDNSSQLQGLEQFLSQEILKRSPANVKNLRVKLREHESKSDDAFFRYTHSLRQHYGNCQRFHGHSNIIEVFDEHGNPVPEISRRAAELLGNKYLVPESYVRPLHCISSEHSELKSLLLKAQAQLHGENEIANVFVEYDGSQGKVFLCLPRSKLLVMPEESTIENIGAFVKDSLGLDPDFQVLAYEGLMKGSIS